MEKVRCKETPYFLHLSPNKEIIEFKPRIPSRTDLLGEEKEIKRICVGESLVDCLLSMPQLADYLHYRWKLEDNDDFDGRLYIYAVYSPWAYVPTEEEGVMDAAYTKELWLTEEEKYATTIIGEIFLAKYTETNKGMVIDENGKKKLLKERTYKYLVKVCNDLKASTKTNYILKPVRLNSIPSYYQIKVKTTGKDYQLLDICKDSQYREQVKVKRIDELEYESMFDLPNI